MPRVQENAPGILPSRSISLGSRISTITTSLSAPLRYAAMASAALMVSISALASSIIALMPRVMVWGIGGPSLFRHSGAHASREPGTQHRVLLWIPGALAPLVPRNDDVLPHQFSHGAFQPLDRDRVHALRKQPTDDGGRFRIVPMPLRYRIEPDRVRIGAGDA